ncbi:Transcriptional regulator, LuxR family [Labilithrix luteola]|uniref:Transcriptional regulator, LuxR family n=1 Tax=Labilithrix luteola TaxID=1391654 RepID=A0A0K1QFG1_9BACT|nr:helix-turn-helix transcriptional regulator [Labilithrix luteola]AKV04387.1 Transcriptional regulator, LuxR family [Labilithrix luteola]
MTAALEAIGTAAVVVDVRGVVKGANQLALARFDGDPHAATTELRRSLDSEGAYCVHPLAGCASSHFLLVLRQVVDEDRVGSRVDAAAKRLRLTPAQVRVLRFVVTGAPNRTIAAKLDISERTVEIHMTALLSKFDADNRAALVALVLAP